MIARLSLAAGLGLGLAACTAPAPPPAKFADIRFTAERPIRLDVGRVELIDGFRSSFHPPEIEYEFPVPPQQALENLCRDRLQPIGSGSLRVARFIIEDASVRETDLPRTQGLQGAFTIEQAQRYDGHVAVRLEIIDEQGVKVREASAQAMRSWSVAEDVTPDEREASWYHESDAMVRSLDQELERQIDARFSPYQS